MLRRREERDRPGPLPGPQAHRLVPARHARNVRACLAGGHRLGRPSPACRPPRRGRPDGGDLPQRGAPRLRAGVPPGRRRSPASHRRRAGVPDRERDPPPARDLLPAGAPRRPPPALVGLATPAPGPRPALPSPATTTPRPITARPAAAIRPACGAPTTVTPDRPADQAASDAGRPRPPA